MVRPAAVSIRAVVVRVHISTHVREPDIAAEAVQLVIVNIQLVLVRQTIHGMVVLVYVIVVSNIHVREPDK